MSSVPPEILVAGSLEIPQDPEIWIYNTVASNHSTFSNLGTVKES
jgi:hypothetical protein